LEKRTVSGIMVTMLLIGMLAFKIEPARAGTIVVPDDYSTIQEAVKRRNAWRHSVC